MSRLVLKSAQSLAHALKAAFSAITAAVGLLTAAGAASHAVNMHRQPAEADLQTLGMAGVSFKRYI